MKSNNYNFKRIFLCGISIASLALFLLAKPSFVSAREVVANTIRTHFTDTLETELVNKGCVVRRLYAKKDADGNNIKGPNGKTEMYVDQPDSLPTVFIINAMSKTPRPPETATIKYSNTVYYFCPNTQAIKGIEKNEIEMTNLTGFEYYACYFLNQILLLISKLGLAILDWTTYLIGPLLIVGNFIGNPVLKTGWPIVQGIANIGFIFALLFIAFSATLHLSSGSPQKMLPRLLIAAILINFSLLIGGILIDASRLAMAILTGLVGDVKNVSNLGTMILKSSNIVNTVFQTSWNSAAAFTYKNLPTRWETSLSLISSAFLIWVLTISLLYITVLLFVRYVALVLLLVISPLAYLGIALPNTTGLAKRWWSEFIKWVLFGPAALFLLILATAVGGIVATGTTLLISMLNMGVVVGLIFASATVGKKLGGVGSGAVMSFMGRKGKQIARAPLNYPKTTALAVGAVTGGVGGLALAGAGILGAKAARKGAIGVKNQAKDFGSTIYKGAAARMRSGKNILGVPGTGATAKFVAGAERENDGSLKAGQSSMGSSAASWINSKAGFKDPQKAEQARNARAGAQAAMLGAKDVNNSAALNPNLLRQSHVAQALTAGEIQGIYDNKSTSAAQKQAILSNPEAVKKLAADKAGSALINTILNLETNLEVNAPTNLSTDQSLVGKQKALENNDANVQNAQDNAKNRLANKANESLIKSLNSSLNELNKPSK